jgi:hypothetical protein
MGIRWATSFQNPVRHDKRIVGLAGMFELEVLTEKVETSLIWIQQNGRVNERIETQNAPSGFRLAKPTDS